MFLTKSKEIKVLNEIIKDKNTEIKQLKSVIDKYYIELNNARRELYELKKNYNGLRKKHEKLCLKSKFEFYPKVMAKIGNEIAWTPKTGYFTNLYNHYKPNKEEKKMKDIKEVKKVVADPIDIFGKEEK